MIDDKPKLKLDVILQEKKNKTDELLEYNKRLDHTVVFYLSAVYAAIGLQAAGKLDLSAASGSDVYVGTVFIFIFLNACILLHGLSQSCWCMSIAKYIHLRLDNDLLRCLQQGEGSADAVGDAVPRDRCSKSALVEVDELGWDDWRQDIKGVAVKTRDVVVFLWMVLVLATSAGSLSLVNTPRFLQNHTTAGCFAIMLLIGVHSFVFFQAARFLFFVSQYHEQGASLSPRTKRMMVGVASLTTFVFVGFCGIAAIFHQ